MGASECSPKVAVHPATPHQVFTHPRAPPQQWCRTTDSPKLCIHSLSCCVSLFMSGVVFVWVSLSLALRCSRSCSLSLSAPPPFLRHTHAGVLIHRVCMTTSPHHGTAGVWL